MSNLLYIGAIIFDPDYFKSKRKDGINKTQKLIEYYNNFIANYNDKFKEVDIKLENLCKNDLEDIIRFLDMIEIQYEYKCELKKLNIAKVYSDIKYFYYVW
jgi:hypothetical protein